MDRKDFEKALAGGSLPSVLLFEGEEEQMKQDALSSLRKTFLPAGMEEMNEMVLDDPETDQLIAAAETLPFLADRRLIIVRDHPAVMGPESRMREKSFIQPSKSLAELSASTALPAPN